MLKVVSVVTEMLGKIQRKLPTSVGGSVIVWVSVALRRTVCDDIG